MFKELLLEEQNINEGVFTRFKNKIKNIGINIDEYKYYYDYDKNNILTGRVIVLDFNPSDDTITYETEDIRSGKKTKIKSSITQWYKDLQTRRAPCAPCSNDEQEIAFDFIQSVYQKDTSIVLKAKTKYILNDIQKITIEDTIFNIAKSKPNKNIDLTQFQGKTIDGDKISFDPTRIKKLKGK